MAGTVSAFVGMVEESVFVMSDARSRKVAVLRRAVSGGGWLPACARKVVSQDAEGWRCVFASEMTRELGSEPGEVGMEGAVGGMVLCCCVVVWIGDVR